MDKGSVIDIANKYSEKVCETMSVKEIILYGSYAKNNADSNSDIDIAVIIGELEEDYLDIQTKLFKLRRSVDLRIEPILFEDSNDKSGFLKEIKETGVNIYSTAAVK